MASTDDDYSTERTESELSFGAVDFDQIVRDAEARQISPRESVLKARKKQKPEHKPRAMLPSNLHTTMLMDKHITKFLYGQDYKYNTSLMVIGAALCMQKGYLQKVAKLGKIKGRLVEKPWI
jgi:hypothetical protein